MSTFHFFLKYLQQSDNILNEFGHNSLKAFETRYHSNQDLRALLVNRPDMRTLTFFHNTCFCHLQSTYELDLPGIKVWDLRANTKQSKS